MELKVRRALVWWSDMRVRRDEYEGKWLREKGCGVATLWRLRESSGYMRERGRITMVWLRYMVDQWGRWFGEGEGRSTGDYCVREGEAPVIAMMLRWEGVRSVCGCSYKSISHMLLHLRPNRLFISETHSKKLGSRLVKIVFGFAVSLNFRLNCKAKHHLYLLIRIRYTWWVF